MKKWTAAALAALTALTLTGCSFQDVMLYLYGGDSFVKSDEPDYAQCDGGNGVTVVYDQNQWEQPVMAQDDTLSLTSGNQLSYTVVLLQKTDAYTDFLTQSGQELEETTGTVKYDFGFTVPDAAVEAVRYDCGSYQTIFAQIDYDCGETIYVTAAARTSDYDPIIALLQNVWPTGHAPENARTADKTTKAVTEDDVNKFRTRLTRIGDCVVVVGDFSLVKVHVHTNDPGKAIQYACELGELVNLKIDNMAEERRERLQKAEAAQKAAEEKKRQEEAEKAEQPLKEYGMVAVSLGEGFSGIFGDLGVDHIVEGGQTMNPSIEDILDAVEKVGAKNVFVLPNNSNVILAASQAAELSERNVVVLPTKNVAMGIGAVIAFNPEASVEENREAMTAAAEQVKTGQITFAVRDTVFEDKEIKEGDIIGIHNGRIEVVGKSIHDIALELVKHVVEDGDSLITIYYGQDTKQEDADALGAEVAEMFSDLDVEVQYGGQPLYYYLISAE